MDREYDQPLNLEVLARDIHVSTGHLSRSFKAAYGETPYQYLMTRRIERAMALLRQGELTVTEVCFAVGSSSLGTFSTRFTELVGVPPTVYREQALAARATAGLPPCVERRVTRPVRERSEAGDPVTRRPGGNERSEAGDPVTRRPGGNERSETGDPVTRRPGGNERSETGDPVTRRPGGNERSETGDPVTNREAVGGAADVA
ncbi:helix-turn-helix transcriptional regulator [Nitriliruptoraceae bacterium ZYF776]|nr:helix-turn-helix transcriptional regulator [Profundirhabdus halotolerans]